MALDDGTRVRVHYRGLLADGSEFDNSYQRGEPIEFEIGSGQVVGGFDEAVSTLDVGGRLRVTIAAEDAYGLRDAEAVREVPSHELPPDAADGDIVALVAPDGQRIAATVTERDDERAVLDFNHPLAGEDLTFELELVEIVA